MRPHLEFFLIIALTFTSVSCFWFGTSAPTTRQPVEEYGECQWHSGSPPPVRLPSGNVLVPDVLHANHEHLPLGSYATVRNPQNKKTVRVEIVGRGPNVVGRVADLSRTAFQELADLDQKVIECTIAPE